MTRRVVVSPQAEADLEELYDFISDKAGFVVADKYVARITGWCATLADFPERGSRRDDLRPGLHVIGFERRATIAFHIDPGRVVIDRILYGGRDLEGALDA